jgi:hypothetical protein
MRERKRRRLWLSSISEKLHLGVQCSDGGKIGMSALPTIVLHTFEQNFLA